MDLNHSTELIGYSTFLLVSQLRIEQQIFWAIYINENKFQNHGNKIEFNFKDKKVTFFICKL